MNGSSAGASSSNISPTRSRLLIAIGSLPVEYCRWSASYVSVLEVECACSARLRRTRRVDDVGP